MTPELDVVTATDFVAGLDSREMDELRAMRSRCQALENSLSYVRRLVQGRLDIVGGEMQRRRDGGGSGNVSELIGRLPDILSENSRAGTGPASVRPPQSMEPDADVTRQLQEQLDDIIDSGSLGAVTELADAELDGAVRSLHDFEERVSNERRVLHTVIDALQTEVTRRYQSGAATVDSLLG